MSKIMEILSALPEKLKSRKFWMGLLGAILPILTQFLTGQVGWDKAITMSVAVILTYIIGQSAEDVAKRSIPSK